jgi:uncharacterized protein
MARHSTSRRVSFLPAVTYFRPVGVPATCAGVVRLLTEEAEAVRLKDGECMEQDEAAAVMGVSRPTFQRVLTSARRKISDALVHGKAVRIGGGHFNLASVRFRCHQGHEWEVPYILSLEVSLCEVCQSPNVERLSPRPYSTCTHPGRFAHCQRCPRSPDYALVLPEPIAKYNER